MIFLKGLWPYNFAQPQIRGDAIDRIYLDQYFNNKALRTNPKFKKIGDIMLLAQQEVVERSPSDVRVFLRLAQMVDPIGLDDPSVYPAVITILREGWKHAPNRQDFYYYIATMLGKIDRFDEGIAIMNDAVALNPNIVRARYYRGLLLGGAGREKEAREDFMWIRINNSSLSQLTGADHIGMISMYQLWGDRQSIADLILRAARGEIYHGYSSHFKFDALMYYIEQRDTDAVIAIAEYTARTVPEYQDEMETVIDLTRQGLWNIIDKL